MKKLEIMNFVLSVKLNGMEPFSSEYAPIPLSIEIESFPLMMNMKMNFNLIGKNTDEDYTIQLDMINIETNQSEIKFYEHINTSQIPWGFQTKDNNYVTALNVDNITNVITQKGEYFFILSIKDKNNNEITNAKQYLKVY